MQIKATTRCYYMSMTVVKVKKTKHTECWWGGRGTATLRCCWWECKLVQPPWKTVWQFLKNLNIHLPYDLIVPILRLYLRRMKAYVRRMTCTWMFMAALFVITKSWEPNCPSTEEWVNCSTFMQRILFSNKNRKTLVGATRWINLNIIMLSERSQT